MAKLKPEMVWVAWLSQWNHASPTSGYDVGVYSYPSKAAEMAEKERRNRGIKYTYQFAAYIINDMKPQQGKALSPGTPGRKVYVASVIGHGREHFLGVYTSIPKARAFAKMMYPGWRLRVQMRKVDEIVNEFGNEEGLNGVEAAAKKLQELVNAEAIHAARTYLTTLTDEVRHDHQIVAWERVLAEPVVKKRG